MIVARFQLMNRISTVRIAISRLKFLSKDRLTKLKKTGFLLLLISFSHYSVSQHSIIEGEILDSKTFNPLPYATIGIKGTTLGTASNSEGKFILSIPEYYNDSILFCSFIGYKSFEVRVRTIESDLKIKLDPEAITLNEIEVRPWEPWDYIWNAMRKIPENYPQNPYMTKGYYSEYISENDVFLKFTEGVIETYNPGYGENGKSQSKVVKARRRNDLGSLKFMRDKLDKKFEKEKRKAEKKGKEWEAEETIDEEIISASFGGPEEILSADPLRDTASFLDIRYKKKYKYSVEGYSTYYGKKVIIIGFESKGIYEHQRQKGSVFISLDSDAIIAIEFDNEIVIPVIARPLIFLIGFGITNPDLHMRVHYKPVGDKWYLNDVSAFGGTRLTKKKIFKKNERSKFHIDIALINIGFDLENVFQIPEDEQIDGEKVLEDQVEPDPNFWESFQIVRPSRLSSK